MSTETSTGNQSTVTTEQDSFSQTLESYTSLVNSLLAESDVTDDEDMATVRRVSSQLIDDAKEIEGQVEANKESIDETQEMVATTRREQAEIRSDVHEVKQTVESQDGSEESDSTDGSSPSDPKGMTGQSGEHGITDSPQSPQTPLGDCVTLPEPIRREELTANVRRATEVASGAIDYCRSVPAGYAITSSELRTVLTALKDDDGRTFTETVSRVIDYLDDLGNSCVEVTETMGGQRTVVFDDEFVRRSVAWRQSDSNGVVTGETVGG